MTQREPGFYWVKMNDKMIVAEYDGHKWYYLLWRYQDSHFTYIDPPEKRLIEPKINNS